VIIALYKSTFTIPYHTYLGGHDALSLGDEVAAGAAAVAVAAVTLVTLEPRDEAVVAAACTLRPASTPLRARVDRPRLAGTTPRRRRRRRRACCPHRRNLWVAGRLHS